MNKFKFIIKGMLLWTTAFAVMLFILGVDSLMDNGIFFQSLLVVVVLVWICWGNISEEELEKITLYKWFNKLMEE